MIPTPLDCYVDLKALQDATEFIVEAEGGMLYVPLDRVHKNMGYLEAYRDGEFSIDLPHGVLPMEIALKMAEERDVRFVCDTEYIQENGWWKYGKLLYETCNPHDHLALLTALVKSYEVKK